MIMAGFKAYLKQSLKECNFNEIDINELFKLKKEDIRVFMLTGKK